MLVGIMHLEWMFRDLDIPKHECQIGNYVTPNGF